jgi:hypothetical protein
MGQNFDNGAVTFTVDVGAATPTWVLVEYTTDPSPTSAIMSRATFTDESITPLSAGTLDAEGRGFLLTSSATITAKLKDVSGRFSWCGYAFDAPPNATVNPEGGYTLRGTPPFIVNGVTLAAGETTFGAGTCMETITDFTYNPTGRIPDPPVAIVSASETEIDPGTEVTFTATASGGATNEMTYTWDIAGTETTNTTNPYSPILSTPGENTYTVRVTNANGCASTVSSAGSLCVFSAGTIATATVYTTAGNAPASPTVNPTSLVAPCFANAEYQWRRSGESAATLSDSNTPDYILSDDPSNYVTAGTYYFNRYAKNKAGDWVPAEGTYTLTVGGAIAPPPNARSTQLWPIVTASGTLVWSDNINLPTCTATTNNSSDGCMKTALSALYGYNYVQSHKTNLCSTPWHVATANDWDATIASLYNTPTCEVQGANQLNAVIVASFVACFAGQSYNNILDNVGSVAWYWFNTGDPRDFGNIAKTGEARCALHRIPERQKAVRCVRTL